MADPFLLSHSCGPLQFSIAGPLTPVSIRDQMLRAKLAVDRLIEQSLISAARPLLVVGAGAGGATAAIRAAELDVPVTLVEASHQAFGRQKRCATRWVDPTQYDWPADHWPAGVFPWNWPPMPLPWVAQTSSLIAALWERELRRAAATYPHLTIWFRSTVTAVAFQPATADLLCTIPPRGSQVFGAVLYAVGFGVEQSSLGTYRGFEFWENDPFESPRLGLPPSQGAYRVLIAGGGDGALQDFIRVATGLRSAADLLRRLPAPVQVAAQQWVSSVEDQALRAGIWCERKHEHAVFDRLHQIHKKQIDLLYQNPRIRPGLMSNLEEATQHAADLDLTLAYPCTHFGRSYGLNRFLVLLLLRYAVAAGLPIRETPSTGLHSISAGHSCGNPWTCHGLPHQARLLAYPACAAPPTGPVGPSQDFDVLVLRLGVRPPAPFSGTVPLLITRQILPYHAPE